MTVPSLLLGFIVAILPATIFHFLRGGNGWRLLLFIGLSVVGFFLMQWLGGKLAWSMYPFGALDLGLGIVGSVLFVVLGDWLIRS